jgi:hypothetical protein
MRRLSFSEKKKTAIPLTGYFFYKVDSFFYARQKLNSSFQRSSSKKDELNKNSEIKSPQDTFHWTLLEAPLNEGG